MLVEVLLRRFKESAFRYFHPELNPNAGRNGSLSDDPHLNTSFPLTNWSGGNGPTLAEQLTRKFDYYGSVSAIGSSLAGATMHLHEVLYDGED